MLEEIRVPKVKPRAPSTIIRSNSRGSGSAAPLLALQNGFAASPDSSPSPPVSRPSSQQRSSCLVEVQSLQTSLGEISSLLMEVEAQT